MAHLQPVEESYRKGGEHARVGSATAVLRTLGPLGRAKIVLYFISTLPQLPVKHSKQYPGNRNYDTKLFYINGYFM